ncbi:MAG: DinB family protein [Pseudomonadota bacterium]
MKAHFEMMAAYNDWANRRLFEAAADLPDADYRADCGAFFRSVHGTLNHLFVADVIWLARFRGDPNPPWALDSIAHDQFDALRARRVALDHDIMGFVGSLTDARIAAEITYRTVLDAKSVTQQLAPALSHFFNHQTHHRGQCHALLTRLAGKAPALDLLYFQRER